MSADPPPAAGPPRADPAPASDEQLLAADRRTIVIAVVAVVALVLVGITSAALFSPSACSTIEPSAVAPRAAGSDLAGVLPVALPGLTDDQRDALLDAVSELATSLGPLSGAADVRGAERLAWTPDGITATGRTTTALDAAGAVARGAADTSGSTVVGDGDTLYALALTNELTGQVDALQPLDRSLAGLTCQDTATVATPLAFHLDAGDGQLLLLRIDEDGDDPDLELRDPVAGRVWPARFDAGLGPAGTVAARLTASLGEDLVVAARRSAPDDEGAIVTAVERATGQQRWTVGRDDVLPDGFRDEVVLLDVLTVTSAQVVVAAAVERADDGGRVTTGPAQLWALDPATGARLSEDAVPVGGLVVAAAAFDDGRVAVLSVAEDPGVDDDASYEVVVLGAGVPVADGGGSGSPSSLDVHGEDVVLVGTGAGLDVLTLGERAVDVGGTPLPIGVGDVAAEGERVTVLLVDGAGGALALSFGG
jgi:hypothetical protein